MRDTAKQLSEKFGFSYEEALKALEIDSSNPSTMVTLVKPSKKVKEIDEPVTSRELKFPLPFSGRIVDDCCVAVLNNSGLFSQCLNKPSSKSDQDLCSKCDKQAQSSPDRRPPYGFIQERIAQGDDYIDPKKGSRPVHFTKVMRKLKLTREMIENEVSKLDMFFDTEHFVEPENKRGRPKKNEDAPVLVKSKKASKNMTVETHEDMSSLSGSEEGSSKKSSKKSAKKPDLDDVFYGLRKELFEIESKEAQKKTKEQPNEFEKMVKKAEKEAQKKIKEAEELEKEQKKAEKEAQKKAKEEADELEKEQKKAEKEAQKKAKEQADELEKQLKEEARKAKEIEKESQKKAAKEAEDALKQAKETARKIKEEAENAKKAAKENRQMGKEDADSKKVEKSIKKAEKESAKPEKKEKPEKKDKSEKKEKPAKKAPEPEPEPVQELEQEEEEQEEEEEEPGYTVPTRKEVTIQGVTYIYQNGNVFDMKTNEFAGTYDLETKIFQMADDDEEIDQEEEDIPAIESDEEEDDVVASQSDEEEEEED